VNAKVMSRNGDTTPGEAREVSKDRIGAEQIRSLFRTAPVGLNAALVGAFVLCGVLLFLEAQTPAVLARWMAFVIADYALRQGLCAAFRKVEGGPFRWRAWAAAFTAATALGGLVWGVGAVYVMTPSSTEQLVVMETICPPRMRTRFRPCCLSWPGARREAMRCTRRWH
jgi:hypothetical protein